MQTQEYRLTIPSAEIYEKIYKDYISSLKQAKIMISDYYDDEKLILLKEGIVMRKRTEDGRNVIQTIKKMRSAEDNLFISEFKEELQDSVDASKMYKFILQKYRLEKLKKVLTFRTLRQMYFCKDFDFVLDKTQYENKLNNEKGTLYEVELDIFSLNKGDVKFLKRMKDKYQLQTTPHTKVEKVMIKGLDPAKD